MYFEAPRRPQQQNEACCQEHGAHSDMTTDKAPNKRPNKLACKLSGDGITQDTAHHAFWYAMTYNCRNTGQQPALRRLSRARWLDKAPENPAWDDHYEIIAALRAQKTDKAAELLSRHLQESRLRLLEAINSSRRSLRARGIAIS